jgi:hypothetical protein
VHTRRVLAIALAAGLALAAGAGWLATRGGDDPYRPYRQATEEDIPGTFGYVLSPVGSFDPDTDPARVYDGLVGASNDRRVWLSLARVRNDTDGFSYGPSWVFMTRNLCYFTAKGDLVAPARYGDGDACTHDNFLVQVVDAETGEFRDAFTAFDSTGGWVPDRLGDPAMQAGAPAGAQAGTTRFH